MNKKKNIRIENIEKKLFVPFVLLVFIFIFLIVIDAGFILWSTSPIKTYIQIDERIAMNQWASGVQKEKMQGLSFDEGELEKYESDILTMVQEKDNSIKDIQSIEKKEDYLNLTTVNANREVNIYAYPLEEVVEKSAGLKQESLKMKKEAKKSLKNISKNREKLMKEKKEFERKRAIQKRYSPIHIIIGALFK